jgi:hypothetical protein
VRHLRQSWATGITEIQTHEGLLKLALVLDLCFRQVTGWSKGSRMSQLGNGSLCGAMFYISN